MPDRDPRQPPVEYSHADSEGVGSISGDLATSLRKANNPSSSKISQQYLLDLIAVGQEIRSAPPQEAMSLSYMANMLVRISMPHRVRKGQHTFSRTWDGTTLSIMAPAHIGLPSGTIPRMIMAWLTTEAVVKKSPIVSLGDSFPAFLRDLGFHSRSGGVRGVASRVKDQLNRTFSSVFHIDRSQRIESSRGRIITRDDSAGLIVASKRSLWWETGDCEEGVNSNSWIKLSQEFFDEITDRPVPVDMRALRALTYSPLALDIYVWAAVKSFYVADKLVIPWGELHSQFGTGYPQTPEGTRYFRKAFRQQLQQVRLVYEDLKVDDSSAQNLVFYKSKIHVPREPLSELIQRPRLGRSKYS